MAEIKPEVKEWLDSCIDSLGLIFKDITYKFLIEELSKDLLDNISRHDLLTELKNEIRAKPELFEKYKEFFRLHYKERQSKISRSYYRINESDSTLAKFNKDVLRRIINNDAPNDDKDKSGFLNIQNKNSSLSSVKYVHYPTPEKYFDSTTGEFKIKKGKPTEIDFTYDHSKNLIATESNDYKKIISLISDLKEITTYSIEPFGVYYTHDNEPTKVILEICKKLFDDSWMSNDSNIMSKLAQENTPHKFVFDLFNKNEEKLKKIGDINLSKCVLSFNEITSDKIVEHLLKNSVVIIGFGLHTYYKNTAFTIRLKTSMSFASLVIDRSNKNQSYNEMFELKDKIEKLMYDSFK